MKPLSIALLSLLLLSIGYAAVSHADSTLTIKSSGSNAGDNNDSIVYTRNGFVRVDIVDRSGENEGFLLFDSNTKRMVMFDTKNKRKMDMSEKAMEQRATAMQGYQSQMMAMMEQNMKNLSADQQRMIREKMNMTAMSRGAPSATKQTVKARIVKVGKDTVNSFDCVKYDAFKGDVKSAHACFASAGELDLSKSDYKALKAMFAHTRSMQEQAKAMAGAFGGGAGDDADFMGDEVEGIPVYRKDLRTGEEVVITEVSDATLPAKMFEEPDYPSMEGATGIPGMPQ